MEKFSDLVTSSLRNKTLYRILFNWQVAEHCQSLKGKTLDLAAGKNPSYYRYLKGAELTRLDIDYQSKPDEVADLNRKLPWPANKFDNVLFFNAIYILENPERAVKECCRVLKFGGFLFLASPFVFNEAPEPHDYWRFTSEKLKGLIADAGFSQMEIVPFGGRWTAAVSLISRFLYFSPIKLIAYWLAIFCDKITKNLLADRPCPLGYFCIAKK